MMGLPVVLKSFDELAHSIRTGRPSIELSDPDGLWGHLAGAPCGTRGVQSSHDRQGGGRHRGRLSGSRLLRGFPKSSTLAAAAATCCTPC
jgi:hypothetical protein